MKNLKIREAIENSRLKHYEVAEMLGISEGTFSRKLRKELSKEEEKIIIDLITNYKEGVVAWIKH